MILRKASHRAYYSRQFVIIVHPFPIRFDGQIVDITGGASGIGAAIAKPYIAESAKLIVADMCDDKKSEAFVVQFDGKAYFHKREIFDPLEASSIVTEIIMQFSDLDIVYNNSAAFAWGEIPDKEFEQWSRVCKVVVDAPFYICKAAIPWMKKQTRKKQRGAIINTCSSADHARDDIRINAVCPGWTETAMAKSLSATPEVKELVASSTPMHRPATPEELAAVMLFLASEDASNVTGSGLFPNQQYHSLIRLT